MNFFDYSKGQIVSNTYEDYIVESRNTDGKYERFNLTNYMNYRRAVNFAPTIITDDSKHYMVGKSMMYVSMNKKITFTKVRRAWSCGFYYVGTYVDERGSHGAVCFENINSIDPVICNAVKDFGECYI